MFLCLLVGFCCCFLLWFYYNLVSVLIYSVRNITFYFSINRYFGVNLLASQTLTQPPISVHTKLRMGKINMQLSPNIILSKTCFDWNQLTLKSIYISDRHRRINNSAIKMTGVQLSANLGLLRKNKHYINCIIDKLLI